MEASLQPRELHFKLIFLMVFLMVLLVATPSVEAGKGTSYNHIPREVVKAVSPYLLTDDHPIKQKLDEIFKRSRAILSVETMKEAGFMDVRVRKWTHIVVTQHPELPGYIIKTFLDSQRHFKGMKEHERWIMRINGAKAIQAIIDAQQWNNDFKVPNKWIYMLPTHPAPRNEYSRKNFILVEDDMQICSEEENKKRWKSDGVNKEKLNQLYIILETLGLDDCAVTHNIPFGKDGKIAFIDTESWGVWPVGYDKLTNDLPEELQEFWKKLYKGK